MDLLGLLHRLLDAWLDLRGRLPAPPRCEDRLSGAELRDLLIARLNANPGDVHLSDSTYDLYPGTELARFLANDRVNGTRYVPEVFDCDNFARAVAGAEAVWQGQPDPSRRGSTAFGEVWGEWPGMGPHALCFWVEPETRQAWLVEPQNDAVFPVPEGFRAYLVVC